MADSTESTIVGESILITGNLHGDEDLMILGRVEGNIGLTKTLTVAESGVVKAEISVRNAVISGIVVGNITATDSVQITESGRLVGDLRAPRVIITAGARVRGQVDMGDLEAPRASLEPMPARALAASNAAALARSQGRPASSLPARRPTPVASTPVRTPMPRVEARPMVNATPAATSPAVDRQFGGGPMAAKKIKKKVVVKATKKS